MSGKTILLAERGFSPEAAAILSRAGTVVEFGSKRNFLHHLPAADVVMTALDIEWDKSLLDRAFRLSLIGSRTTQLRYIDLKECRRRRIKILNIHAGSSVLKNTPSTAEETMALILSLVRKIPWAFEWTKQGKWGRNEFAGIELAGKKIGLVGFGRLGRMVARYSRAFSMIPVAFDPRVGAEEMRRHRVRKVGLESLLKASDIVSVHAVYDASTRNLLGLRHFKMMKPSAWFINTARGEITDEHALLLALKRHWIAGAAVDTLSNERPDGRHLIGHPLVDYSRRHENLIIVPHLGGSTREAVVRTQIHLSRIVAREIRKR